MKRILTLVTTLAFVALLAAPAQAQEKGEARFGVQGGISLSNFTGDAVSAIETLTGGKSSKTGFMAGLLFDYYFSPMLGIGLEANWLSGLGAKFGSESDETEIKLSYFSFPLTLNLGFGLGEEEKVWLGLEAGIAANLTLTCDGSFSDPTAGPSVDCKDDVESIAWTVPLGAGIGFMASDAAVVFLKGRYQLGLSDLPKDVSDFKMSWWEFILGVSFVP